MFSVLILVPVQEDRCTDQPGTLRELLVRLMQTQARQLFGQNYLRLSGNHHFAYIIGYIREKIDVDKLSEKACMSRANFFRKFKEEFGYSPAEYILKERVRLAKKYLLNSRNSITQVCYMAGFQNLNYFIRAFKKRPAPPPEPGSTSCPSAHKHLCVQPCDRSGRPEP